MKLLTLLLFSACLCSVANAQTPADTATAQIRQLLKPGKHLIHYARPGSKPLTPEQTVLLAKIQKAMSENLASMMDPDSIKSVSGKKEDIEDAIRQKLGLTREEWETYQDMTDPAKKGVAIYGEDTLEVIPQGEFLSFRGTGKARALDSVRLDLSHNKVLFRQHEIPFIRISHVSGSDNGFHTPAVSYMYELNNSSMSDSTDAGTLRMESFDFGISRFPLTGKTMVAFFTSTVQTGGNFQVRPNIMLAFLME